MFLSIIECKKESVKPTDKDNGWTVKSYMSLAATVSGVCGQMDCIKPFTEKLLTKKVMFVWMNIMIFLQQMEALMKMKKTQLQYIKKAFDDNLFVYFPYLS